MKVVSIEKAYSGYSKIDKVTLENKGETFTREVLRRGSSVTLLAYDSRSQQLLITKEFRVGEMKERMISSGLIAGMIDDGDKPEDTCVREAEEEAGLKINASELQFLGKCYTSPGITDEISYLYLINTDLTKVDVTKNYGCDNENESISLELLPFDDFIEFLSSTCVSASSLALLTHLKYQFNFDYE